MSRYAFEVHLALLLLLRLVFQANIRDLDFALYNFQSVLFRYSLPFALSFCRGKILDFGELAIQAFLQFKIKHNSLYGAA